jgi:hypothetical protein
MMSRLERKIAEAIWTADGTLLRLLDEVARPHTVLSDQQGLCWVQARAVVGALSR